MKTLIAIIIGITSIASIQAEVPRGVDKKWDSTLTCRVVGTKNKDTNGRRVTLKIVEVTGKAPSAGPIKVTGPNFTRFEVPAGKTITKRVTTVTNYEFRATYNGKLLDVETDKNKTGLGSSSLGTKKGGLNSGGLGSRKKFGQ